MFDDYVFLRPFKGVAEILAKDNSWGNLYDLEKLAKNEVKVTAATYVYSLVPSPNWHVVPYADFMKICTCRMTFANRLS